MTMLSESQIAEIEAEITARDDSTALESACGEYNCSCHDRLPALCQTVRALQGRYDSAVSDFAAEINRVNQSLSEVTRERDDLLDKLAEEVAKRVNKSVASMEDDRLTDTQRGSFD